MGGTNRDAKLLCLYAGPLWSNNSARPGGHSRVLFRVLTSAEMAGQLISRGRFLT